MQFYLIKTKGKLIRTQTERRRKLRGIKQNTGINEKNLKRRKQEENCRSHTSS